MKNYIVTASPHQQYRFEVKKISIGAVGNCKYDVYQEGKFIANLEPDGFDFLRDMPEPDRYGSGDSPSIGRTDSRSGIIQPSER